LPKRSKPLVSIGLPVFNSENYLEVTIESILAQTFEDFELIISDNASTDRTAQICLDYVTKDPRVHYFRNETNVGGGRNFNRALELASGKYFKWHAHDDLLAPTFIEKCVAVLANDPEVVLVHSRTARIEDDGIVVGNFDHNIKADHAAPHLRLRSFLMVRSICAEQFGLVRTEVLKATQPMGNYVACDRNLLAELILRGKWHIIPEHLFLRRQHRAAGSNIWPLQARLVFYEPNATNRLTFPHYREWLEHFRTINRVSLSVKERFLCYAVVMRYAAHIRRGLRDDLWIAIIQVLRRSNLGRSCIAFIKQALQSQFRASL
jgi:glycosyltransferase involved in cell wall biosynthesis